MILSFNKFQSNLADTGDEFNLIALIIHHLNKKYSLTPVFGAEIEFYISKNASQNELSKIIGHEVKKEKGNNQFEIEITPTQDVRKFIQDINNKRTIISSKMHLNGYDVNFFPKPFADDYGSAIHIHLNFKGNHLTPEHIANILCNYTGQTIQYFLPTTDSFARLDNKFMSPTHICWGGNNRTCLIRIPDSEPKRIEHRLAGADINPIYPVYAILASINEGLDNSNLKNFDKIYGNAFDEQYNLEMLSP